MKDHKLAAIVFTDIVGYTKRMDADEETTMKLLVRQREIIFPLVKEFGGEVIKEIGDGLLMMFTSANKAVRFAIALQDKLKDDDLTIRAGIHIGDVIFEEGDVFGSAVNIAARIEPLAPPGGICISDDVRSQIRNQGDIFTSSIGKKILKGVKEPVEIHRIITKDIESADEALPFYKDLWKRRVFQITGIYMVIAFLIKIITGYLVEEYMLSPHIESLVWIILLSLIPSVILVSYFHGKRGVARWTKVELIGMPLNVVLAFLIAFFVFKDKELGAMTTRLTVQNEYGENIEKLVVKNEFRKNISVFNLKNISGDTSIDYLQYGIPRMLVFDLSQDNLLTLESAMEIYPRIAEAGYEDAIGLPITLMQRFAEQRNMAYFMSGNIDRDEGEYLLNLKLYETKSARLISEIIEKNNSPFELVDKASVEIKKALDFSDSHISETVDLPISEIFTASDRALYHFSHHVMNKSANNWTGSVRHLNQALEEDPSFALAYGAITLSYFNLGDIEATRTALQSAMEYLYKLPENQQFLVKYVYYVVDQQPEKALNVAKMWTELYPEDLTARSILAERYVVKNMLQEAIAEFKVIMQLDPEFYRFLELIGDYYLHLGNFDSSLAYYQKYAQKLPRQATPYQKLGDFYKLTGDLDLARENYEKALLLSDISEKVPIKVDIAGISLRKGDMDLAYEAFQDALRISRTARDSADALNALEQFYLIKGQVQKSLESHEMKIKNYRTFFSPKNLMAYRVFNLEPYIYAGKVEQAFEILEEIGAKLEPPLDNLIPFGYLLVYAETGQTEKATEALSGAQALIDGWGEEIMMANIYYARGKINEALREYETAIDYYNKFLEMNPMANHIHTNVARCYRHLKDFKKADEQIQISLKHRPFDPLVNYEAALIYLEKDEKRGLEYLEKAVEIWKDADPGYEKANIAKEKLNRYH